MDLSHKTPSLHNTTISIIWSKISNKTFPFILGNNQTITSSSYSISDKDIHNLLLSLGKSIHLHAYQGIKPIKFELSWQDKLTYNSFKFFHTLLSHHLNKIQHLALAFNKTAFLTDKYLENFSYTLHRFLPDLKKLELDFGNCTKLTNDGLKHFVNPSFSCLKNLEELVLVFHTFAGLEDSGVKILVCGISRSFSNLKYLELDIIGAFEVTNQSLRSVGYYLGKRMVKLESFVFQLMWSYQVTQSAFDGLRNELKLSIKKVEMEKY